MKRLVMVTTALVLAVAWSVASAASAVPVDRMGFLVVPADAWSNTPEGVRICPGTRAPSQPSSDQGNFGHATDDGMCQKLSMLGNGPKTKAVTPTQYVAAEAGPKAVIVRVGIEPVPTLARSYALVISYATSP